MASFKSSIKLQENPKISQVSRNRAWGSSEIKVV
uniref:Uncharacterized protein n=1 Tax=Anguilla anguilla TaxID=7936 RepID=A0A0E9SP42_ANGAN